MTLALSRAEADLYVPDGASAEDALDRVRLLGVAAHADDLEIMAWHGIRAGDFAGVVCTDGRGAPRSGRYADTDDDAMREIRREEQREAARRGRYALVAQLDHPSDHVKDGAAPEVVSDLRALLEAARPEVVYTHNPMDAHPTHLGACAATLEAITSLPPAERPAQVLGCEGWRSLDWLDDADKTRLLLGDDDAAWASLVNAFASQVEGGRPYDAGALGRAHANAVFDASHEAGGREQLWLAVDLTPVAHGRRTLEAFVRARLDRFEANLLGALGKVTNRA